MPCASCQALDMCWDVKHCPCSWGTNSSSHSAVSGKKTALHVRSQRETSRGGCRGEHVGDGGRLGRAPRRDKSRCPLWA